MIDNCSAPARREGSCTCDYLSAPGLHDSGLAIAIILIHSTHGTWTSSRSVFVAVSASEMR